MIETSGIRRAVVRLKCGMQSRARWSCSVVGFFAVSGLTGLLLATPLGAQVPSATPVLVILQAWQASVQALLQHTPSGEQIPPVHWLPEPLPEQVPPAAFFWVQVPAAQ